MTNRTLQKNTFQTASIILGLGVILGAFGAHGLKNIATPYEVDIFHTGTHYQFIHGIGLLILSLSLRRIKEKTLRSVTALFITGIILFSGSLYVLGLRTAIGAGDSMNWIGIVTPIGGLCFICGWFYLALEGYKATETQ